MKKLTRYTSMEDLKTSNDQLQPQQPGLKYKQDLAELIAVMKQHSFTPKQSKPNSSFKKSGGGK